MTSAARRAGFHMLRLNSMPSLAQLGLVYRCPYLVFRGLVDMWCPLCRLVYNSRCALARGAGGAPFEVVARGCAVHVSLWPCDEGSRLVLSVKGRWEGHVRRTHPLDGDLVARRSVVRCGSRTGGGPVATATSYSSSPNKRGHHIAK